MGRTLTEKPCVICKEPFQPFHTEDIYCGKSCRDKAFRARRKQRDPDYYARSSRNMRKRMRESWGTFGQPVKGVSLREDPRVISSELFVAQQVLPSHGFMDIFSMRQIGAMQPFDIIARRDGQIFMVEVTTALQKAINRALWGFAKSINAKILVCHVKPDLSFYVFRELAENQISTAAWGAFNAKRIVNQFG